MVKLALDARVKAVLLFEEKVKTAQEICSLYCISKRTFRRWRKAYMLGGVEGLKPNSNAPHKQAKQTSDYLVDRITRLKKRHPSWGAKRIKHQYDLPVHGRQCITYSKEKACLCESRLNPSQAKDSRDGMLTASGRATRSSSG